MHILIAGDSWSQGEWDVADGSYRVVHQGLIYFLQRLNYNIVNVGYGGSTNTTQVERIQDNIDSADIIIWFQTDPLRERWSNHSGTFWDPIHTIDDLFMLEKQSLDRVYKSLNILNRRIYCIGGVFALDLKLIKKYENLVPLIPFIPTFLLPEYEFPRCINQIYKTSGVNSKNIQLLDFLVEDKNKHFRFISGANPRGPREFRDSNLVKYFWPDGTHLNRYAYKKLYHYLKKQEIIKEN